MRSVGEREMVPGRRKMVLRPMSQMGDTFISKPLVCFEPASKKRTCKRGNFQESRRTFQLGSNLVALARPTEIRTRGDGRHKMSLWPFTFLNYTKMTRYEALEKNAVSEPKALHLVRPHLSKSPALLGDFQPVHWRRNRSVGVNGGGRGTGIEPSPRSPE